MSGHLQLTKAALDSALLRFEAQLAHCQSSTDVLAQRGQPDQDALQVGRQCRLLCEFTRAKHGSGIDMANRFLDHGNYLAYGIAATACWVIGLPTVYLYFMARPVAVDWCLMYTTSSRMRSSCPKAFIAAMAGKTANISPADHQQLQSARRAGF